MDEPRPGATRRATDAKVRKSSPRRWRRRHGGKRTGHSEQWQKRLDCRSRPFIASGRALGLQPHQTETFKLSPDPLFVEKVRDIAGLYLNPPEHAVVLCVDEKSQIQALNRTQPILPLRPGVPERQTHDYERNGITTLFAALNAHTGEVVSQCYRRHRSLEYP